VASGPLAGSVFIVGPSCAGVGQPPGRASGAGGTSSSAYRPQGSQP
jgi:hypothetical protein